MKIIIIIFIGFFATNLTFSQNTKPDKEFAVFFKDFKNAVKKGNHNEILEYVCFPFLSNNNLGSLISLCKQEEFFENCFFDWDIKEIQKLKLKQFNISKFNEYFHTIDNQDTIFYYDGYGNQSSFKLVSDYARPYNITNDSEIISIGDFCFVKINEKYYYFMKSSIDE
jgi:hypothetical protein